MSTKHIVAYTETSRQLYIHKRTTTTNTNNKKKGVCYLDERGQIWGRTLSMNMFGVETTTRAYMGRLSDIVTPSMFFVFLIYARGKRKEEIQGSC